MQMANKMIFRMEIIGDVSKRQNPDRRTKVLQRKFEVSCFIRFKNTYVGLLYSTSLKVINQFVHVLRKGKLPRAFKSFIHVFKKGKKQYSRKDITFFKKRVPFYCSRKFYTSFRQGKLIEYPQLSRKVIYVVMLNKMFSY